MSFIESVIYLKGVMCELIGIKDDLLNTHNVCTKMDVVDEYMKQHPEEDRDTIEMCIMYINF